SQAGTSRRVLPGLRATLAPGPGLSIPIAVVSRARGIQRIADRHRYRVGFFSRRAPAAPDAQRAGTVGAFAREKLRQHLPGQRIERTRMPKKTGLRVDQTVEQQR